MYTFPFRPVGARFYILDKFDFYPLSGGARGVSGELSPHPTRCYFTSLQHNSCNKQEQYAFVCICLVLLAVNFFSIYF